METMSERIRRWDNDSYAHFERWSAPHRELSIRADKDAYDIAKLIIQSLLFIQAGGLVIIPTSNSLKEIGFDGDRLILLLVILSLGVIATIAASIFAFFALSNRAEHSWILTEAYEYRARSRVMSDEFVFTNDTRYDDLAKANDIEASRLDDKSTSYGNNYITYRTLGIAAVLISSSSIIAASAVAAYGLVSSHRTPTEYLAHFEVGFTLR